jgi:predicted ATPase
MRRDLPTGTVTFLFTDIEGSTKLLHVLGAERYEAVLDEHRRQLRETFAQHGGVEVDTQGDAFFYAFPDAAGALEAARDGQAALAPGPIAVRMGLHTGRPHLGREGYIGDDVHLGARIAAAAHGGQVVCSRATADAVELDLLDLGEHRLKDIPQAVSIYQLGGKSFPPLTTISNTNLPRPASSFVGRDDELLEVLARFEEGARLVTLTGPGGTGKTRLAIEAAVSLVPDFKAGVFWVGLAAIRDAVLVTETIGQTLGAKDGLAEHIGERQMLLLLDNLEQVVECAPQLSQLLEACPNLTLLVTSRELLRVQGEVEYAVPPLAESEAVELFCARAQVDADDTIAELCRRLDDMPLAVELAAARTGALTPAQILARVSLRLDLLRGGRDADPRQQTLRATIEWSYELLSEEEQQLFARLSVFAGGCTLEAAEAVAGADLDTLQSLLEKSLLRFTNGRYWMLETIREYAAQQLAESGDADLLVERLARYLVELAYGHGAPNFSHGAAEAYARLGVEHPNVRTVIDWAERRDRPREAAEVVAAWAYPSRARGHATEASGWIPLALRARGQLPGELWTVVLLCCEHLLVFGPGDKGQARALMEEALDVARALEGQAELEATVLSRLSAISRYEGRLAESRAWAERSLAVRVEHDLEAAPALAALASLALAEDDLDRAEELLVEVRDLFARDGHRNAAVASRMLGEVERRRGNVDKAVEHVTLALRAFAELAEGDSVGECLEDLARLAKERGDVERAARLWAMGHTLWVAAGEPERNPLFPTEIGDLPELRNAVPSDIGVEEAVAYALGSDDA